MTSVATGQLTIVDANDGAYAYTATVYAQQFGTPDTPTGGSFDFGTKNLTVPDDPNSATNPSGGATNWSASIPTSSTTPTYVSTFLFFAQPPATTAAGGTWSIPVSFVVSGTNAISGQLSNDSVNIPASSAGVVASGTPYNGSGTEVRVYEGATLLNYNGTGTTNGTWTVSASGTGITASVTKTTLGTAPFQYVRYGDHSLITADVASITYTITGKSSTGVSFSFIKTQVLIKNKAGVDSSSYYLSLSSSVISKSALNVLTPATSTAYIAKSTGISAPYLYAGRFIIATSLDGTTYTDVYNSNTLSTNESFYTYTIPATAKTIRVRAYLIDGTTLLDEEIITIVSDGSSGNRGSGEFYAVGSSWIDSTAANAVYAVYPLLTYPAGLVYGDTVTISNNSTFAMTKYWNGSAWTDLGTVIDGNLLVTNSITASKINSNGLSIKDASGNIILAAGSALDFSNVGGTTKPDENATVGANFYNTYDVPNLTTRPTIITTAGLYNTVYSPTAGYLTSSAGSLNITLCTSNTLTTASHGLTVGTSIIYNCTATPIAGLTDGVTYYITAVTSITFKLSSTRANAILAVPAVLTLGALTAGTHTINSINSNWLFGGYSTTVVGGASGAKLTFTRSTLVGNYVVGLTVGTSTSAQYSDIDYAIYLLGGSYYIRESGADRGGRFGICVAGDRFAVLYDGGTTVSYYINGINFYSTVLATAITSDIIVDASISTANTTIDGIGFGAYTPPTLLTSNNLEGKIHPGNASTYIANAAIAAAQIGSINLVGNFNVASSTAGERMTMDSQAINVYDSNNYLRVRIGNLA